LSQSKSTPQSTFDKETESSKRKKQGKRLTLATYFHGRGKKIGKIKTKEEEHRLVAYYCFEKYRGQKLYHFAKSAKRWIRKNRREQIACSSLHFFPDRRENNQGNSSKNGKIEEENKEERFTLATYFQWRYKKIGKIKTKDKIYSSPHAL